MDGRNCWLSRSIEVWYSLYVYTYTVHVLLVCGQRVLDNLNYIYLCLFTYVLFIYCTSRHHFIGEPKENDIFGFLFVYNRNDWIVPFLCVVSRFNDLMNLMCKRGRLRRYIPFVWRGSIKLKLRTVVGPLEPSTLDSSVHTYNGIYSCTHTLVQLWYIYVFSQTLYIWAI